MESSTSGAKMVLFTGPAAHQGSSPTKDPRIPGITSGGDTAQPASSRPHREILIGAMVLVAGLAALAAWMLFKPAGPDTAARASAAESGLVVSTDWHVESIDGGFRLVREFTSDRVEIGAGYYFDIVQTSAVSAPTEASTWKPEVAGATAYAEGEPPLRLLIDAGEHSWIVTPRTLRIYTDDGPARAAWYDLANSISFTSGP